MLLPSRGCACELRQVASGKSPQFHFLDRPCQSMIGANFLKQEMKPMRIKMSAVLSLVILAGALVIAPVEGQRGAPPVQLPAGSGQELVQNKCAQCHGLNLIAGTSGFSKEGWAALVATMVALPKDEAEQVSSYLAANFP